VETEGAEEIASTALVLAGLDLQLRRHHYHSPDEDTGQMDLIELRAVANLEWDEKDGLWAQLDELITFDITPTGSSICVYLDEEPVVTLWANPTREGTRWLADWEADLTHSEQQRFLRRVGDLGKDCTQRVLEAVDQVRTESTGPEERSFVTSTVRDWLSQR
jgi:hypothetical protein